MEQQEPGSAMLEGRSEDRPRLDGDARERAAKDQLLADEAVRDVEEEHAEDLLVARGVLDVDVPGDEPGRIEQDAGLEAAACEAAGDLVGRREGRTLRLREVRHAAKALRARADPAQAAEIVEDACRQLERRLIARVMAHKKREQLAVSECTGTMAQQALAKGF